ncbi:MAG: hypothetical protein ACREUU_16865, partial [Gammaproteobacteria bacterium]
PDSRAVGFFANGKLQRVDLSGGTPLTICSIGTPTDNQGKGATWNQQGTILFATVRGESLHRVSASGGPPAQATTKDPALEEESHRWPYFLPDGKHFLYLVRSSRPESNAVYAGSLDSQERKLLFRHNSSVIYVPPGYLLFVRDTHLMAQPFDAKRLELTGEPALIGASVVVADNINRAAFSASGNGLLSYLPVGAESDGQLVRFDRNGRQVAALALQAGATRSQPRLSPDGKTVAYGTHRGIWLLDLARGVHSLFTESEKGGMSMGFASPVWFPDGTQLAFSPGVLRKALGTAEQPELLVKAASLPGFLADDFSADGKFLLLTKLQDPKTAEDLWLFPLSGADQAREFLRTDFSERAARFSPNGRWFGYVSNESGQDEIYVRSFPSGENKTRISTNGGIAHFWRRDGKEIVYLSRDSTLMSVPVEAASSFKAGVPQALFKAGEVADGDMTADGRGFYFIRVAEESLPPLTVLLNWTAELKR